MGRRGAIAVAAVIAIVAIAAIWTFHQQEDRHDDGRFDDIMLLTRDDIDVMPPERFDEFWDNVSGKCLEVSMHEGSSASDIGNAIRDMQRAKDTAIMNYMLVLWNYYRDPGAYGDERSGWMEACNMVESSYRGILMESLSGPNADTVASAIGREEADDILSQPSAGGEEISLTLRENELIDLYYGTDPGDREGCAGIYLELIDVRNRIAEIHGYGSYAEYAYTETYDRGYGPDDLETFNSNSRFFRNTEYIRLT